MKNMKDIIIGIFAVIGVLALVSGFTNNTENAVQTTTPESHVWQGIIEANDGRMHLYNKKTGEVRKYALGWPENKRQWRKGAGSFYITYLPVNEIEE